jgi:hypothetical protein
MIMSELIERLGTIISARHSNLEPSMEDLYEAISACKEALQQSQWVSAEDEVPEIGQSFDAWHMYEGRFADHGAYAGHGWDKQSIKESMLIHLFTHWMPLPTPPAKEQG